MRTSRFARIVTAFVAVATAGFGMNALTAAPAAADTPFGMTLVGGTLSLGTLGTTSLNSGIGCQNGADDELAAPFGAPDGLVDYPADPQCANAYDADETTAGFQAPDPVEFTGTVDGSLDYTVTSSFVPVVSVRRMAAPTLGVCDDDVLVTKVTTTISDLAPHTGSLGAGTLTLNLGLDNVLDIRCDTDLGVGQSFTAFDFDGAGGMDPWGGATPVHCAHDISSLNASASGDTGPASLSKAQDPAVTNPMSGKNLEPAWLFGDAFDAVPSGTGDTRCGFFDLLVFGAAAVDNSAVQFGFIQDNYNYVSQSGNDVNVGDVTVPEGDGGLGAQGCGGKDCKNSARVIVSLESPCTDLASCYVTVIADNTTGGSANGTPKGNEVLAPGPADYKATTAAKPKVLRIAYGKSTAKFTIPIVADQAVEAAETIFVDVVSVSAGLVVNDGTGMVTIVDDDDLVEPDTGISIGDAIVYETAADPLCKGVLKCKGVAVLPIVASTGVLADTTLTYTIGNGDDVPGVYEAAEAVDGKTLGDDFRPFVAKTKLLKTGKNSLALVVTVFGDNDDENGVFSGETFTVSLTGSGVADGIGTVRINNDD